MGQKPSRETIRKILVLKIKNSSVFYHYPIEVYVFESTMASSMSWFHSTVISHNRCLLISKT